MKINRSNKRSFIMKKSTLLLSLLLFTSALVMSQDTLVMRTKPFLQSPVNNGITVSWLTNYPTFSWVEYGLDKNDLKKAVALQNGQVIANNTIHHVRLDDLEPNSKYYYRVVSKVITQYGAYSKKFGKQEESELYSFTSHPKVGDKHNFTAIVFNDLHQQIATAEAMVAALNGQKYDLVIFNGDCIDDPKDETQAVKVISKFNDMVGASQIPVIYLRGNHEIRNAYSVWLYDILQGVEGSRSYGSLSWGDTRLMLLDCGEDKPDDHWVYYGMNDFSQFRKDQVEFILAEKTKREFKKSAYRVLIHHIPLYGKDNSTPCHELWGKILNNSKIDCAINAHTHRIAFHPVGEFDNKYPVLVGGGYKLESACITTIKRENKQLVIEQLGDKGKVLKTLTF